MTRIQLSDHFTYGKLLRYTLPSIAMVLFTSVYSIIDGLFIANFVGKIPFAGINFIWPFVYILGSVGMMFGSGGSALVAKVLGENDQKRANGLFSLFIYVVLACGCIFATAGFFIIPPLAVAMGAEGEMLQAAVLYGQIIVVSLPGMTLQIAFQSFFSVAEKPRLGFVMSVLSGIVNIALDALFVIVLHWGIAGAAVATVIAQIVGGFYPFIYFARDNDSLLKLGKAHRNIRALIKAASNGISEFINQASMSVVGLAINTQLLRYGGENAVAAYGIIMYMDTIFFAAFIGFCTGSNPLVSYNYGAGNHQELHNLFKRCLIIMIATGIIMMIAAELLAYPLSYSFASYDADLLRLTTHAYRIYSLSFAIVEIGIFGSNFFTALNNGLISGTITFMRVLVFELAAIYSLPLLLGLDGIWWGMVAARCGAAVLAAIFFISNKKKYRY